MTTPNPVNEAVKDLINIDNLLREACREEGGKDERGQSKADKYGTKFRSRIREFPTLLISSGLIPATTFLLSKAELASEDNRKFFNALLSTLKNGKDVQVAGNVCNVKDESAGTIILLAIVVKHLERFTGERTDHDAPARSIARILLRVAGHSELLKQAEGVILTYALEAKKLAEAFYRPE